VKKSHVLEPWEAIVKGVSTSNQKVMNREALALIEQTRYYLPLQQEIKKTQKDN